MMAVSLELTGDSKRELARLEREAPRMFKAAHGSAATRAQNRLRKVMRVGGGVYGVPTFAPRHEMTMLMRPSSKPGGMLADKWMILKGKLNDGQWIGWADRVTEWASVYQGAQRYPFEDWQKAAMHRDFKALAGYHIPAYYERPARKVIDPFAEHLAKEFPGMVMQMFRKYLKSAIKRGREIT